MIEFNVAEALDKLDMMSFEEAQEWIAELDKEGITQIAEHILEGVRQSRYKQALDDVLLTRGKSSNGKVVEMRNGSCKEWLDELISK